MSNFTDFVGGSSGGGVPIGTILPIKSTDNVYQSTDGTTWLRSGFYEDDPTVYPDAEFTDLTAIYSGSQFSTSSQDTNMQSITTDGTHLYVVSHGTDRVYKYTLDGSYVTNAYIGSQEGEAYGITWDGTHFWLVGVNRTAYKYDTAWAYTGTSFSVSDNTALAMDITWDGTHFWITGWGETTVFQYTAEGVYTGVSHNLGGLVRDVEWNNGRFWVRYNGDNFLREYTSSFSATGTTIDTTITGSDVYSTTFSDNNTMFILNSNEWVSKYNFVEGVGINEATDSDSGLTLYMRVK